MVGDRLTTHHPPLTTHHPPVSSLEKINVIASFAGFATDKQKRRIVPHKFMMRNGEVHVVAAVRKSYTELVGDAKHVHFVVKTAEGRYFDIVYDSKELAWFCVLEIEEGFLAVES